MTQITQSAVHCINPHCQRPYPQPWGNKFCHSCGSPLQLLNRYVPLHRLGLGGFSHIYTLWDTKTQSEKVLKVLIDTTPKALELFIQEAEVLSNFRYSGVPKVDADGYFQVTINSPQPLQLPCLVMEKINGQTLESVLQNSLQGCPEDQVLQWFIQAILILQELHKKQIIHRDIKPSNLMLRNVPGDDDQLVLIDFGGAKQFTGSILQSQPSSTRLYSSGYSPQEQVRGGNVGPAADFYALGRTMIQLLTGKYPPELEDAVTGKLKWRGYCQINSDLADLLDEMIAEDVPSRPPHAAIIYKRLLKIASPAPKSDLFNSIGAIIVQAATNVAHTLGNVSLSIIKLIWQVVFACLATIWTIFITSICTIGGTVIGFFLAYHTHLGDRWLELFSSLSSQLPTLLNNKPDYLLLEFIMYALSGLGTSWGITLSGCFGQKRRFILSALLGCIGYALGWIASLFISPLDAAEAITIWILTSLFILIVGLGLRSHKIAYAILTPLLITNIIALLYKIGLKVSLFHFTSQPHSLEFFQPVAFFTLVSIALSLCLSINYYLIVPFLRWLGWR
ncbi:protein kinase [Anabaena sp. FACHB-1237]|nr:protein kinase [Anabaena sp. FACHB-1237]